MRNWKKAGKRLAGLMMSLCVAVTGVPIYAQEAKAAEPDDLLVHYDFEGLSGGVTDGTTIEDVSGNDHDATAKGNNLTAGEGSLTFPGGANGSGAGYVELPGDIFVGQDTLTVSIWMKNETGAGNYTGFYIGNRATTSTSPTQYFLLNPKNPNNVMKAVLTNTLNESAPYNTEVGVGATGNASDGPATTDAWQLYTVVLTEDTLTGYLDGEKYKTYDTAACISDFGEELVSYIGRSPYPDMFYKGGVKDLQIYTSALSEDEIMDLYLEGITDEELIEKAEQALEIPEAAGGSINCTFVDSLTLPETLELGKTVEVTWSSDHPEIISNDGQVSNPAEETVVTLTATLAVGGATLEKKFEIRVIPVSETTYSMVVDPDNEGAQISQELIGLFFEDINSAADGGLYPEMVKNYSFENYFNIVSIDEPGRGNEYTWKLHWSSDHDENFRVEQEEELYLNENNTNYAIITGNMTLKNGGFAPMNNPNSSAMPIEKDAKFDFSIYTRADASYAGTMKVRVVNEAGDPITDEQEIKLVNDGEWQKATAVLTGTKTVKGSIEITISGAKADDVLYMDMVSLSPQDTYGYGDKNYAYGKGVRKDLVEKLIALNPSFIRFPGGCIIEGNSGRNSYYNWEWSVGPLEERKPIGNHWASDNGSNTSTYGYMQSFGFGYHEILKLCEDMGAEPFPILSAGVFCQFANGDNAPAASGEELDKFAQHATHLIDYCWGSPLSQDETQKEWATKRVQNGHEDPFNLNYVGIGNENWGDKYLNNFQYIKGYVEDYVAEHYPGRSITIISSSGPAAEDNSYKYAWDWMNEKNAGETLVDEHYYQSKEFMLNNDDRYDYYRRLEDGGSNVFLGEYATHLGSRNNNLESAICDAAYMTGIERNGDIVRHASYAPLFEKIGSTNWTQNMIRFDEYDSLATPNYYVQQMFSNNYGEQVVNTTLEKKGANYSQNTGSPIIGTWATAGYITHVKVTREDGTVLLDDDFSDNSAGWEAFPGSGGTFNIADGRITFSNSGGMNCVWLPDTVNNPEWYDYKVEVTAVKTSGAEGFLVGAGAKDKDNYFWYNMGGWQNTKTSIERARTNRGKVELGNNFEYGFVPVKTNEEMDITFNYGVGDKLEAGYTSATVDQADDFSGNLRPYQNDIYQVASKDDEYIYLKLVNHDSYAKDITLTYPCEVEDQAEIICLTGNANDVNNIGNEVVVPETTTQTITDHELKYLIPAMSFTVIKVRYQESQDKVVGITLDQEEAELEAGQSVTLKATVEVNGTADNTVTWSSSDESVATVKDGVVTAVKAGSAIITAKAGDRTATCKVTVKAISEVTGISLDKTEAELEEGESVTLKATVEATGSADKTVTWSSSDESVATVKDGTVTGVKAGTAVITAKAGDKTATCTVTVKEKVISEVTGITLDQEKAELEVGASVALKATVEATGDADKTVTWSSSDESVATVGNGTVTAVKAGTAVITAKAGDKTATCTVTVKEKENPNPNPGDDGQDPGQTTPDDQKPGTTPGGDDQKPGTTPGTDDQKPQETVTPKIKLNAAKIPLKVKQTTKAVVIKSSAIKGDKIKSAKSSNKKVATVKVKKGKLLITGKRKGTATITVTSAQGATAKLRVNVQKKKVVTKSLKMSKKSLILKKGKKAKLQVVRKPITAVEKLKFTSSNKKVATVSAKGVVTAKKKGKATITVRTANNKKAVCKITVK